MLAPPKLSSLIPPVLPLEWQLTLSSNAAQLEGIDISSYIPDPSPRCSPRSSDSDSDYELDLPLVNSVHGDNVSQVTSIYTPSETDFEQFSQATYNRNTALLLISGVTERKCSSDVVQIILCYFYERENSYLHVGYTLFRQLSKEPFNGPTFLRAVEERLSELNALVDEQYRYEEAQDLCETLLRCKYIELVSYSVTFSSLFVVKAEPHCGFQGDSKRHIYRFTSLRSIQYSIE